MNMLLKNNYAFEQGMKGERGDSGRPGVHVSLHVCVCVIYIYKHTLILLCYMYGKILL